MKTTFNNGGFMLSWQKAAAWYDAEGNMLDCEKKLRNGTRRSIPARCKKEREWLERQGKNEAQWQRRLNK